MAGSARGTDMATTWEPLSTAGEQAGGEAGSWPNMTRGEGNQMKGMSHTEGRSFTSFVPADKDRQRTLLRNAHRYPHSSPEGP